MNTIVLADTNVAPGESNKVPYDPRTKSDMDDLAPAVQVAGFTASLKTDWALFVEDRLHSIRRSTNLPNRWLADLPGHTGSFSGVARPGEFYVFQIAVFAAKSATGDLAVKFSDLTASAGRIKSTGLCCLSLGGTNFAGQPFTRQVKALKGQLQTLWVGVDVPKTAAGTYHGAVTVTDTTTGVSQDVALTLTVAGEILEDHGDKDSWRLSRLRWLNSTLGLDDNVVTQPFTPIVRGADTLKILGRDLVLGADGLPRQVISRFNAGNTAIEKSPTRELLAAPFRFEVETDTGTITFSPDGLSFTREQKGAVTWRAVSRSRDLELTVDGLLEYDGFADFHCRFKCTAPVKVRDIRLETAAAPGAADYFMGLGHKGGKAPAQVDWKWNADVNQDGFWLGAVNGGFKLQLYGANWRTPLINCYYAFRPLLVPESWGGADGRSGGIRLARSAAGGMHAAAFSGPRTLAAGDTLEFDFRLFLTPFKPIDTDAQWTLRYFHPHQGIDDPIFYQCEKVKAMGASVINIHHCHEPTPTINYPYFDLSMPLLKRAVDSGHANGLRVKIYYTTREITSNLPELFAFWSLNGEIICASPGKDGRNARPLTNGNGPHPWLLEHLGDSGFIPAWREVLGGRYQNMLDLAVITTPDSRLDNFYLEGLAFTLRETGFDGLYIDDTSLGRKSFQRAHRIFEAAGKPLLADMHSWSHWDPTAGRTPSAYCYMQNFPYYHRLWFGEGFDYNTHPDYWLVEMSGIPFGLMSEMLQDGGNKWRGMVFGMTSRLGWSGDPRPEWKCWDDFGMNGSRMSGWWDANCPVKTDTSGVFATVYQRDGRALIALASWAPGKTSVKLSIDWKSLGLDPEEAVLRAPAIDGYQAASTFAATDPIPLEAGRGWLLVAEAKGEAR